MDENAQTLTYYFFCKMSFKETMAAQDKCSIVQVSNDNCLLYYGGETLPNLTLTYLDFSKDLKCKCYW